MKLSPKDASWSFSELLLGKELFPLIFSTTRSGGAYHTPSGQVPQQSAAVWSHERPTRVWKRGLYRYRSGKLRSHISTVVSPE